MDLEPGVGLNRILTFAVPGRVAAGAPFTRFGSMKVLREPTIRDRVRPPWAGAAAPVR